MFTSAITPSENTRSRGLKIYTADNTGKIFLKKLLRENSIPDSSAYEVVVPNDQVWETLRTYHSQMQELEAYYGTGGQRIKHAHEILQKNMNELNKLIHDSNAEAINILLEHCSENLKSEIQTKFDGDKYVFSSIYAHVMDLNDNTTVLWGQWRTRLDKIMTDAIGNIRSTTAVEDYYKSLTKALGIMATAIAEFKTMTIPSELSAMLQRLSATPDHINAFYRRLVTEMPNGVSFKQQVYTDLKQEGFDILQNSVTYISVGEYTKKNEIFEDHVKTRHNIWEQFRQAVGLFTTNNNTSNKQNGHKNKPLNKQAKTNTDEDSANIASQNDIYKLLDDARKEGNKSREATVAYIKPRIAPAVLPNNYCWRCYTFNCSTKTCSRCSKKDTKVSFDTTIVGQIQTSFSVQSVTDNSNTAYNINGKPVPQMDRSLLARSDSGCDFAALLSRDTSAAYREAIKSFQFDTICHQCPTYISYKGVGNTVYRGEKLNSLLGNLIIYGQESRIDLIGENVIMKILQQYDPNATLMKKGTGWLFTFKGEIIINATPDANGDVYFDVLKLLYIFNAIATDTTNVAVIASNAKPQSNTDNDDNDDADNDNASNNSPSNSNFKNSPSRQTPDSNNIRPDTTSGGTNIGGTNSGGTQCPQSSTTHSQADPLYLPASGTLKKDYEECMSSFKPDEIIMGEKDSTAQTETLQEFFEYGYVPDLFLLKDGNDNHRASLTKSGNIGFLVIPSNIYPNARKDEDIPSSVKQAQLFYNCFEDPNLKSMKLNIQANPHLPFTLKDVKIALQIYGNIPADVGNMKRKRRTRRRAQQSANSTSLGDRSVTPAVVVPPRPPLDPVIPPWPPPPTPTKTTISGHTIHVDIKQLEA